MADLSDSANWFEVDGSNNRPPPNGWPEGMMPSGVNDTSRADKGALKRFWDRANPVQKITPAGGVFVFTTSNSAYPTDYVDGEVYSFIANSGAIGGDQFQVNALIPKPIQKRVWGGTSWAALIANDIVTGQAPYLVYNSGLVAGSGAFMLLNPYLPIVGNGTGGASVQSDLSVGGSLFLGGNYVTFANLLSGPYIFADPTSMAFRLGPSNGSFFFANNSNTNVFQVDAAGNGVFTGNVSADGPYLYLNGASGSTGPHLHADGANWLVKAPPGNGGFFFYDASGAPHANIDFSTGSIYTAGALNVTGAASLGGGLSVTGNFNASGSIFSSTKLQTGGDVQGSGDLHIAGNGYFLGQYVYLNGGTGAAGSFIHSDNTNTSIQNGGAGGTLFFMDHTGTAHCTIGFDTGAFYAAGPMHIANTLSVDGALTAGTINSGNQVYAPIGISTGGFVNGATLGITGNATVGGTLNVTGQLTTPGISLNGDLSCIAIFGGADGNAGTLATYNSTNLVTFRWDGTDLYYRINGGTDRRILHG